MAWVRKEGLHYTARPKRMPNKMQRKQGIQIRRANGAPLHVICQSRVTSYCARVLRVLIGECVTGLLECSSGSGTRDVFLPIFIHSHTTFDVPHHHLHSHLRPFHPSLPLPAVSVLCDCLLKYCFSVESVGDVRFLF